MRFIGRPVLFRTVVSLACCVLFPSIASAFSLMASYCNDNPFDSDGGGVSYCSEVSAHFENFSVGAGLYASTDEQKKGRRSPSDRLQPLSRLNFMASFRGEKSWGRYAITPRLGIEGGFVDDFSIELQKIVHSALGVGQRDVESTKGATFLYGISGYARDRAYERGIFRGWNFATEPYAHGSVGNDTIELGGGLFFSLQPSDEQELLPLSLPKIGSYLGEPGGEGVAIYLAGRGVARETLYDDMEKPWIAEIGALGRVSVYNNLSFGASATCSNRPYRSSLHNDCKAEVNLNVDFDERTTAFDTTSDLRDDPAFFRYDGGYDLATFNDHFLTVPVEVAGLFAGITALGLKAWGWGEDTDFHFESEGFFGGDAGSLGMDKLGHAYTSYLMTEFLTHRIRKNAPDSSGSVYSAGLLSYGLMTYVEVFDGFAVDHGFSYEDMIFNALGVGFSVARNYFPGLHEKLDFRLEYLPSDNKDSFRPLTDYSGQKYVFVLKASGFPQLSNSFLKYFELHAGYFARGFTDREKEQNKKLERNPYVGIGLNLQEVLFGAPKVKRTNIGQDLRRVLEYVQVPYTYVATEQ